MVVRNAPNSKRNCHHPFDCSTSASPYNKLSNYYSNCTHQSHLARSTRFSHGRHVRVSAAGQGRCREEEVLQEERAQVRLPVALRWCSGAALSRKHFMGVLHLSRAAPTAAPPPPHPLALPSPRLTPLAPPRQREAPRQGLGPDPRRDPRRGRRPARAGVLPRRGRAWRRRALLRRVLAALHLSGGAGGAPRHQVAQASAQDRRREAVHAS